MGASHRNTVPALLGAAAGEFGLRGVEVAVGQTSAHPLDEPGLMAGQRARVPARADVGCDPVLGVEAAPGAGLVLRRLRRVRAQADVRAPHTGAPVPAGRGRAECGRARGVRHREGPAEGPSGPGRHPAGAQPGLLDPAVADRDRHDVRAAVGHGRGQPLKPLGLQTGRPGELVGLADHGVGPAAHGSRLPRPAAGGGAGRPEGLPPTTVHGTRSGTGTAILGA